MVNTAGTLCKVDKESLVVLCTLPSICHTPVWVLDIVAVTVVSTVLAGLARKVHLDGTGVNSIFNFNSVFKRKVHLDRADVSEEGAADISRW